MTQYFVVELSDSICLGIPLADLVCATQLEPRDICLVPGVAPFLYGVVNFRGSLLWVLDSHYLFDFAEDNNSQKLTAIVINHRETSRRVALVVRQLKGIMSVEPEQPTSSGNVSTLLEKSCTGIVRQKDRNLYLLNSLAFFDRLYQYSVFNAA